MPSIDSSAPDFRDVRVIFRWQGSRVTLQELRALQRALPALAELGLTEVREWVGDSDRWFYKVMPRWQAEAEVVRPAEAVGLRVELIEVPVH